MIRQLTVAALMVAGCARPLEFLSDKIQGQGSTFRPTRVDADPAHIGSLRVPPGFAINVFARDLGHPRMLAVGGEGEVYVTRPHDGDVLVLTDRNNDGTAENRMTVAQGLPGVHGIALGGDRVYLGLPAEVKVATVSNPGAALGPSRTLVAGLPTGGHDDRTLALGPEGKLYISVGSVCNDCQEESAESATILQTGLDGAGRRIFARGLRNTIGFDWHPQTHALWGMDHGIDWLGPDIPPEELNQIIDGGDYGWPHAWGDRQVNPRLPNLPAVAASLPPALEYQAHSAPIGFVFYRGNGFPAEFKGDAFAAMHGSWNRKPATGYKVVRVRFKAGKPTGFEDFLTGFLVEDGKALFGRPAGLAVSNDGALLVSDDVNGVIYRVAAVKAPSTLPPPAPPLPPPAPAPPAPPPG